MTGTLRLWALSLAIGTLAVSTAAGYGGGWSCSPAGSMVYVPSPYRYAPTKTPSARPETIPRMPNIAPIPKANPQPNPGKQPTTAEPPVLPQGAPKVIELRSLSPIETASALDLPAGRCKVGFWNITGQDVTLTVNGQSRPLAKDQAVTLSLERTFIWQITGRPPQSERVAETASTYEVVLRP